MDAVHQPIEHDAGEVDGIVVAHLQTRQDLLPLAFDLFRRERRASHQLRHEIQSDAEAVLHYRGVNGGEVAGRSRANRAADRVDGGGNLLGTLRRRTLIEQRRGDGGHAPPGGGVLGAAGAHDQPEAHRRLFVMRYRDHLQPVGQGLHLVRRKADVACQQRRRRALRRPVRLGTCRRCNRQRDGEECGYACHRDGAPFVIPRGTIVITRRFSGVKYLRATRWTSAWLMFMKMSNSPSAVLMSLWMTTAWPSCDALSLFDSRPNM